MSVSAVKKRRGIYVREAATKLVSLASHPLSTGTAQTFKRTFSELIEEAGESGAELYVPIFESCRKICETVGGQDLTELQQAEASAILKDVLVTIQTSLFTYALTGEGEKDEVRFKAVILRIEQFFRSFQKTAVKLETETSSSVASAENPTPGPAKQNSDASSRADTVEPSRLLTAATRLVDEAWAYPALRKSLTDFSSALLSSTGMPFSQICEIASASSGFPLTTDTPEQIVEGHLTSKAVEQLCAWLSKQRGPDVNATNDNGAQVVASARVTASLLWVEARFSGRFVMESGALGRRGSEESYLDPSGRLIQRAAFNLSWPVFDAYELCYGERRYLIPAMDVLAPETLSPRARVRIDGTTLMTSEKTLLIRWRENAVLIEADEIRGPASYISKPIGSVSSMKRGIAGLARSDMGPFLMVLDIDAWLEGHSAPLRPPGVPPAAPPFMGNAFYFMLGERFFAVPGECVIETGEIDSINTNAGFLETSQGAFYLQDLKPALGIPGAIGKCFLILSTKNGAVAWVVDRLAGILSLPSSNLEKLSPADPYAKIAGLRAKFTVSASSSYSGRGGEPFELYLLDPETLVTDERDSRAA